MNVIEGILDKVTTKWDILDQKMDTHMETLIKLEKQKLELEQQRLQLKRDIAGLSKISKNGQYFGKYVMVDLL